MASSVHNFTDSEYSGWLNAYMATVSGNMPAYPGLTAGMVTALGAMRDTYGEDLLEHDQVEINRKAVTLKKNGSRRTSADEAIRLRDLTAASGASEEALTALGFPKAGPSGEATMATVPVATVDTSERLRHTIHFWDSATAGSKRNPKLVVGLQIYNKIGGAPPASDKDCGFLGLDTKTPYVVEYDAEHAGQMVHYMFRWLMRDGSVSAWGETVSATITG